MAELPSLFCLCSSWQQPHWKRLISKAQVDCWRWELKGLGVQAGADMDGAGSTQGPSAQSQAGLVREQYLGNMKAHLGLCALNSCVEGCDATSHFLKTKPY